MLDECGVRYLALDIHSDGALLKVIRSQPGWTVDLEDEEAVLFVKNFRVESYDEVRREIRKPGKETSVLDRERK